MRFFPLLDFQDWVLGIVLGTISLILIYVAFAGHSPRPREEPERGEREILSPEEERKPIPPIMWFVYLGTILFGLGYFLLIGLWGEPF